VSLRIPETSLRIPWVFLRISETSLRLPWVFLRIPESSLRVPWVFLRIPEESQVSLISPGCSFIWLNQLNVIYYNSITYIIQSGLIFQSCFIKNRKNLRN
jgi:hypothetical protein